MPRKKRIAEQVATTLEAGGEVWFGDETTVREWPPLRAAWAKRGQQAVVVLSGRKARRVIHGALNAASGDLLTGIRSRSHTDEGCAFVQELGNRHPKVPKLLIWDHAPPHHPKRVQEVAAAAHITIAWLPFRSPERNPTEDLWRLSKAVVAANRSDRPDREGEIVQQIAEQAVGYLDALTPIDRLRCSGLLGSKFQWLST